MKLTRLAIEEPHEEVQTYHWDAGIQRRYHMDEADIDLLESGKILWRGNTAFSLEEDENDG